MCVNERELVVVMLIGMLVARGVARVIHAGVEIRVAEILVLVTKPKRVADLLTHDEIAPRGSVVGRSVEVRVVELHDTLGNVRPGNPYLRNTEPAVTPICAVAHLYPTRRRFTIATTITCDDRGVEHN